MLNIENVAYRFGNTIFSIRMCLKNTFEVQNAPRPYFPTWIIKLLKKLLKKCFKTFFLMKTLYRTSQMIYLLKVN